MRRSNTSISRNRPELFGRQFRAVPFGRHKFGRNAILPAPVLPHRRIPAHASRPFQPLAARGTEPPPLPGVLYPQPYRPLPHVPANQLHGLRNRYRAHGNQPPPVPCGKSRMPSCINSYPNHCRMPLQKISGKAHDFSRGVSYQRLKCVGFRRR